MTSAISVLLQANPTNFKVPASPDFSVVLPELIVIVVTVAMIIVELFLKKEQRRVVLTGITLLGYLGGLAALIPAFMSSGGGNRVFTFLSNACGPAYTHPCGMVVQDDIGTFFKMLFLVAGILAVLYSATYIEEFGMPLGEFYALLAMSIVGMMVVASSVDLISLFVGIELSSLCTYILTGWARGDSRSNEASVKYFLLGIFATAILVYGMTWIFGLTGSTNLDQIALNIGSVIGLTGGNAAGNTLLTLAVFLLTAGLAFKIAAVPFHMWTPDAYQGAPTPMTAFMSVAPKAAGFAAIIRILVEGLGSAYTIWVPVVIVLSILTMTLGNVVGVSQRNVKRMLAYSSIAHTGYILLGLSAYAPGDPNQAVSSVLFYTFAYTIMNMGAFGIIVWLQHNRGGETLDDFSGLSQWAPIPTAVMTICLLSLTGIPPTVGFFGKYYVFVAAIKGNLSWLAVIGALNSAIAAFYYLRIIWYMFFREATTPRAIEAVQSRQNNRPVERPGGLTINISLGLSLIGIFVFFFIAGPVVDFTIHALK